MHLPLLPRALVQASLSLDLTRDAGDEFDQLQLVLIHLVLSHHLGFSHLVLSRHLQHLEVYTARDDAAKAAPSLEFHQGCFRLRVIQRGLLSALIWMGSYRSHSSRSNDSSLSNRRHRL